MLNLEDPQVIQSNALKPRTPFLPYSDPSAPIPFSPGDIASVNRAEPAQRPTVPDCWELSSHNRPQYENRSGTPSKYLLNPEQLHFLAILAPEKAG